MHADESSKSQECRILECIGQEEHIVSFYANLMNHMGPDCEAVIRALVEDHQKHIQLLRNLLDGIEELRDLTGSIAD